MAPAFIASIVRRSILLTESDMKGGLISVFMGRDVKKRLFQLLLHDFPLTIYEMTKETGISETLIRYHLPQMIRDGIIVVEEDGRKKIYSLQNYFYQDDVYEELVKRMIDVVDYMADFTERPDGCDLPPLEVMKNNLKLFMETLHYEA